MERQNLIKVDPEIQGGTPCFIGTRVPVQSLFDYLARGRSLDYFLEQFPSVSREVAVGVMGNTTGKLAPWSPSPMYSGERGQG